VTFLALQELTAADLNAAFTAVTPLFVRKTSDETVNNSAVLQNDDQLLLSVAANTVYELTSVIRYNSGATPDIKLHYTVPAGASLRITVFAQAAAVFLGYNQDETTTAVNDGVGSATACLVKGIYIGGSNAGTLQLQWAQNTANASNTQVLIGSYMTLMKVA